MGVVRSVTYPCPSSYLQELSPPRRSYLASSSRAGESKKKLTHTRAASLINFLYKYSPSRGAVVFVKPFPASSSHLGSIVVAVQEIVSLVYDNHAFRVNCSAGMCQLCSRPW